MSFVQGDVVDGPPRRRQIPVEVQHRLVQGGALKLLLKLFRGATATLAAAPRVSANPCISTEGVALQGGILRTLFFALVGSPQVAQAFHSADGIQILATTGAFLAECEPVADHGSTARTRIEEGLVSLQLASLAVLAEAARSDDGSRSAESVSEAVCGCLCTLGHLYPGDIIQPLQGLLEEANFQQLASLFVLAAEDDLVLTHSPPMVASILLQVAACVD